MGETSSSAFSFPEFFVTVVVEADAGDAALCIVLEGEAARAAGGVEKRSWAFGQELRDVADAVAGEKLVSLAVDGGDDFVLVFVIAGVGVVDR